MIFKVSIVKICIINTYFQQKQKTVIQFISNISVSTIFAIHNRAVTMKVDDIITNMLMLCLSESRFKINKSNHLTFYEVHRW